MSSHVNTYSLGFILKQRRKKLGLSQSQVCHGICETITLSRFENGKQSPSRRHIQALFQRLGLPTDQIFEPVTEDEVAYANLENELASCTVRFERASNADKPAIRREALQVWHQLENIFPKPDRLIRQQLLRYQFLLGKEDGPYPFDEAVDMLLRAIRLTVPEFTLEDFEDGLYSARETKVINNIAMCYYRAGKHEQALSIFEKLYHYLRANPGYTDSIRGQVLMVGFNYQLELHLCEKSNEVISLGEELHKECIDYGYYQHLPSILALLAQEYCKAGKIDRSTELFKQAHALYKIIENDNDRLSLEEEAKNLLNLELS